MILFKQKILEKVYEYNNKKMCNKMKKGRPCEISDVICIFSMAVYNKIENLLY